jgi:hypothetical protein
MTCMDVCLGFACRCNSLPSVLRRTVSTMPFYRLVCSLYCNLFRAPLLHTGRYNKLRDRLTKTSFSNYWPSAVLVHPRGIKKRITNEAVPNGHMAPSPADPSFGIPSAARGCSHPDIGTKCRAPSVAVLSSVGRSLSYNTLLAILERCFQRTPPPSQPYGWTLKVLFSFLSCLGMHFAVPEPWAGSLEEERMWASRDRGERLPSRKVSTYRCILHGFFAPLLLCSFAPLQ